MAASTAVCGGLALPVRGASCHRRGVAIRSPFAGQAIAAPRPVSRVVRNVTVRASYETEKTDVDVDQILKDLQGKWDKIDNKTSVVVYGAGAVVLVWLSSTIVGAVNAVPLLPKLLELVGLGYSAWFVYRYLLFKSSREELIADIEELKRKITT